MEADRFDTLTRHLSGTHSRRGALTGLLGGTLGLVGLTEASARKRKKHKKKCPPGYTACGRKCFDLSDNPAKCGSVCSRLLAGQDVLQRGLR